MSVKEFNVSKKVIFLRPDQEFITLQSALQVMDIVSTGGMAKAYLAENPVIVNGESENRRGRKLYPNDIVRVGNDSFEIKEHGC